MSDHKGHDEGSKRERRSKAYTASITTAIILAVLTAVEWFVGLRFNGAAIMMLLGLLKAYFVVNNFMHVSRLWSTDGGH